MSAQEPHLPTDEPHWDYIVVGSGAGGGTLAARLAESGQRVLLLEAGGDAKPLAGADPENARLPADYDVPAFHAFASENPAISWNFFVNHYRQVARQQRDPKWNKAQQGILYPRASTLGGCTAHNAMIFVGVDDEDWNVIAELTGDDSWRATAMRTYMQRVEHCEHRPFWKFLRRFGMDPTGHGWQGWLSVERAMPLKVFGDDKAVHLILDATRAALWGVPRVLAGVARLLLGTADPNDVRHSLGRGAKVWYTPLSTNGHARVGARERVRDVEHRCPEHLHIELHALVTKVLFDDPVDGVTPRAVGVEYMAGARLYRASVGALASQLPTAPNVDGEGHRSAYATREVILAGGAFNTPQLLMLSGIGDARALAALNIPLRVDLPGVGRNLQDRYEIGVVNKMRRPWRALAGGAFDVTDALYQQWSRERDGMYISNGASIAVTRHSSDDESGPPDIFAMALLARFEGYFSGYSKLVAENHDYLTWVVLKAHTNNRAGTVELRTPDPLDPPLINFNYFDDGDDDGGADLRAVVAGIRFMREMTAHGKRDGDIEVETLPGEDVQTDAQLAEFVKDQAWGHHACGTCAIGSRDKGGVLDAQFRVHGVQGLRVVDASVFPRIPGYFIVSAVYAIAEKAADDILSEPNARGG